MVTESGTYSIIARVRVMCQGDEIARWNLLGDDERSDFLGLLHDGMRMGIGWDWVDATVRRYLSRLPAPRG
jgi:hypothetical protein